MPTNVDVTHLFAPFVFYQSSTLRLPQNGHKSTHTHWTIDWLTSSFVQSELSAAGNEHLMEVTRVVHVDVKPYAVSVPFITTVLALYLRIPLCFFSV